jgi:translocation and assembly module TamB
MVVSGEGNLRRSFNGKLAIVTPSLNFGGCVGTEANFQGDLRIRRAEPQLIGPAQLARLTCSEQNIVADHPRLDLDAGISEDLGRWRGKAGLRAPSITMAGYRANALKLDANFSGTAQRTDLTVTAAVARWSAAMAQGQGAELSLTGYVGSAGHAVDGKAKLLRSSVSSALRANILRAGQGLAGTPIGPLGDQAAKAAASAMADFTASSEFAVLSNQQAVEFTAANVAVRSGSGAVLTSGQNSRLMAAMDKGGLTWTADGPWALQGGGLPQLTADVERASNGRVQGQLSMAPYVARGAMLAMDKLQISGSGDGSYRFQSKIRLSGPVGDGRVESADLPLSGQWSKNGVLALDGGCHALSAQSFSVAGYRLQDPSVSLCGAPQRPLLAYGPNGLSGEIRLPRLALRGEGEGGGAVEVQAGASQYDLASGRWIARDALVRLSSAPEPKSAQPEDGDPQPATPTHFHVARLEGRMDGKALVGELSGAEARLGAVPLNMSEIAGDWRFADGALTLNGKLRLTDAAEDPRFYPMVAEQARLRFANGTITAAAPFHEERTRRKILDADIVHHFDGRGGTAKLVVKELRFDEQFQPDQLTRLALGVVANVDGSVVGDGYIHWNDAGVTSGGTFATAKTNLAAAFGPVTGLSATINFDDLLNLRTAPQQVVTIGVINPGIAVLDGRIEYQLTGDQLVRIEGGRWPLASGELKLHPATLNFGVEESRRLNFELVGIDAAHLMQSFDFENLNVTGVFDGSLPVEFGGLGGRIVDGRIDSREGGGTVAYVGELSNRNLGMMANFAFGALRALKYSDLSVVLNGELDGEMVTDIRFGGVGQGEGTTQNFLTRQIARIPMIFNVKISAPFRSIFTTVRGLYDPAVQIEQNLPALIRQQDEIEEQAEQQDAAVQPIASEPVR